MDRNQILATLLRISGEVVPDFKNVKVDPVKSYRELGINSMDLMEILAKAMKELKTKLPSDQLSGVSDLDGLVDLFVKASR